MAIFYTGYRPVTKGKNANDAAHPIKGVGEYSNYDLHNTSHILDGAPQNDHVPGTGYHPGDYFLTSVMLGTFLNYHAPLDDPGEGPELDWYTLGVDLLTKRGQDGQHAFGGEDFGHEAGRDSEYSYGYLAHARTDYKFLQEAGHELRDLDAEGTANTYGRHNPHINKGVTHVFVDGDVGHEIPEGNDGYGHNKINEWFGLPSSRAL